MQCTYVYVGLLEKKCENQGKEISQNADLCNTRRRVFTIRRNKTNIFYLLLREGILMHENKLGKKLVSVAAAAAMSVTALGTTVSSFATATVANAATVNELLGAGDFNDGSALPWHVCESLTGKMNFSIQDGVYVIEVVDPGGKSRGGEDRWDCQFRHRALTFRMNTTYRLTFSVWCSQDMTMYSKLGDMKNDDQEDWHLNGKLLDMGEYDPNLSMADVEQKLLSAKETGQEVKYWEGWDQWKNNKITANQWHTYAYEFKTEQDSDNHLADSIGTGEWTFHFGGDGKYTPTACTKEGTIIKFDNLSLINMDSSQDNYVPEEKYEQKGIEVNQVGYYPNLNKKATIQVEQGDSASKEFTIKDSSGSTVYTGQTSGYNTTPDEGSGLYAQILDFSDFNKEGSGYYIECDGKKSCEFSIGNGIYDGMLKDALNYFYQNRSGEDIKAEYISSKGRNDSTEALAREAGHVTDKAYVEDSWLNVIPSDYSVIDPESNKAKGYTFLDQPGKIDHSKTMTIDHAWYDAGDHGKYVVNGGNSAWVLNNLYERTLAKGTESKFADNSGTMLLPEAGNKYPDILDETRVETDFFFSMQETSGENKGMVHHKMHDFKWTALCVRPAEDPLERIVKPVTYAASLQAAAAWAQSARLWEPYDAAYATKCLDAAKLAYSAAKAKYEANGSKYNSADTYFAPIEDGKGGGAYGDNYVDDDFYWAACELYLSTGDESYYKDLSGYKDAFKCGTVLEGGEDKGTSACFTWGTTYTLGTFSLALNTTKKVSDSDLKKINDSIVEAGDAFVSLENDSQYGIPYKGCEITFDYWSFDSETNTGTTTQRKLDNAYQWASNSMVIDNSIAMAYAYDISGNVKYINGVVSAMDYILGRNPIEQSYVTGYGTHATQYVHHRFWSHYNNAEYPYCPNGVLSGGPNSQMQDPMVQGAGYKVGERAPMFCYYDQLEAWSVNECTINWNSPLAWTVSFLEDEAPKVNSTVEPTTEPTTETESTTETTASSEETTATNDETKPSVEGVTLWGDVDVDSTVGIADVVLLNKYLVNSAMVSDQGLINADCWHDGKPTADDALTILKILVGTYTQADMPIMPKA